MRVTPPAARLHRNGPEVPAPRTFTPAGKPGRAAGSCRPADSALAACLLGSLVVSAGLCVYTHLAPALTQHRVSADGPKSRFPLLLCAKHPSDPDVENQCWLNCEGGKGQGLPSQESTVVTNTGFLPCNYFHD